MLPCNGFHPEPLASPSWIPCLIVEVPRPLSPVLWSAVALVISLFFWAVFSAPRENTPQPLAQFTSSLFFFFVVSLFFFSFPPILLTFIETRGFNGLQTLTQVTGHGRDFPALGYDSGPWRLSSTSLPLNCQSPFFFAAACYAPHWGSCAYLELSQNFSLIRNGDLEPWG